MKTIKFLLVILFSIAIAACSDGGSTVAAVPISATATTTAQSLTVATAMASFSPLTPSGGATPYAYSYTGTLPTGLSFSATTGAVTGAPTATYATASPVFSVKDANNVVASTTSTVRFSVVAGGTTVGEFFEVDFVNPVVAAQPGYPAPFIWKNGKILSQAQPATSGTKLISLIRGGVVVQTFTEIDKAFNRIINVAPRSFQPGDIYEIEPAVYDTNDCLYLGDSFANATEYDIIVNNKTTNPNYLTIVEAMKPKNLIIRGLTKNGVRPVIRVGANFNSNSCLGQGAIYVDKNSENILFENFDVDAVPGGSIGKAAIYLNGGKNVTFKNIRVTNFAHFSQNGIFGTSNNSGTLTFENVETSRNGGGGGPEHNYYIANSALDPNFTVIWRGCYSHGSFYGHLLKSRAQNNIIEGSYFRGEYYDPSVSMGGYFMRESYDVDLPNGGNLIFRNNLLTKGYSGDFTNGVLFAWGAEAPDTHPVSQILVENNTFVTFSDVFDTQAHRIVPYALYSMKYTYNDAAYPYKAKTTFKNNVYVGFNKVFNQLLDIGGASKWVDPTSLSVEHTDMNQDFTLKVKTLDVNSNIVGTPSYVHKAGRGVRTTTAKGALD